MRTVFLLPGEFAAIAGTGRIATILGSCVGVALRDRKRGIVGLCHFLLSEPASNGTEAQTARYGSVALRALLDEMLQLGARREEMTASILGGASVVESLRGFDGSIGRKNVAYAREFLRLQGITVVEEQVGGTKGRKVAISAPSGQVMHLTSG
jgi:chemotaxis protein CheD